MVPDEADQLLHDDGPGGEAAGGVEEGVVQVQSVQGLGPGQLLQDGMPGQPLVIAEVTCHQDGAEDALEEKHDRPRDVVSVQERHGEQGLSIPTVLDKDVLLVQFQRSDPPGVDLGTRPSREEPRVGGGGVDGPRVPGPVQADQMVRV